MNGKFIDLRRAISSIEVMAPCYLIFIVLTQLISRLTVFRSEYVKKDLNPLWNAGKVDLDHLCSNDFNASLRITVLDHESNADHIKIGELETSVNELLAAKKFGGGGDNDSGQSQLNLFDSKKNFSGVINVIEARVSGKEVQSIIPSEEGEEKGCIGGEDDSTLKKPGFIDFVSGGCELSLCIAIDYTGSNGKFHIRAFSAQY